MNIVDLLVTIVVVTILVTIVLAIITYIAYKLRLSREPARTEEQTGPQYFIDYAPPGAAAASHEGAGAVATTDAGTPTGSDGERLEGHATEA